MHGLDACAPSYVVRPDDSVALLLEQETAVWAPTPNPDDVFSWQVGPALPMLNGPSPDFSNSNLDGPCLELFPQHAPASQLALPEAEHRSPMLMREPLRSSEA
jgi:hypothetical protein